MFWLAMIFAWLVVVPVVGLCLACWLSRCSPREGVGRHVEAELREKVGAAVYQAAPLPTHSD